jgi:hypothetical protein
MYLQLQRGRAEDNKFSYIKVLIEYKYKKKSCLR